MCLDNYCAYYYSILAKQNKKNACEKTTSRGTWSDRRYVGMPAVPWCTTSIFAPFYIQYFPTVYCPFKVGEQTNTKENTSMFRSFSSVLNFQGKLGSFHPHNSKFMNLELAVGFNTTVVPPTQTEQANPALRYQRPSPTTLHSIINHPSDCPYQQWWLFDFCSFRLVCCPKDP